MRTSRASLLALTCIGVGALAFLLLAPRAGGAQFDPRRVWVTDEGNRWFKETGRGRWTEFINGRPDRHFDERGRTREFVELYTEAPIPTWTRLHPRRIFWRAEGDSGWRPGAFGGWDDR